MVGLQSLGVIAVAMAGPRQADTTGTVDLLIRLLKLGSFVNSPMKDVVVDPGGISQVEVKVLLALAGEGELAGHDLVEIMGLPAMNVSRALASLRARGWIEPATDPENRRRKPVRLTKAGWDEFHQLEPAIAALAEALLGGLSAKQRRDFAAVADRIIASMTGWIVSHHEGVKFHG
jgi:DNA-binding MarR family transcriptional regulator